VPLSIVRCALPRRMARAARLEGVIQPVVLSVQARAAGRHQEGAVAGLRRTGQRLTSIVIPPLMGGIADRWSVGESFINSRRLHAAALHPAGAGSSAGSAAADIEAEAPGWRAQSCAD
jgi:hypothetical protein